MVRMDSSSASFCPQRRGFLWHALLALGGVTPLPHAHALVGGQGHQDPKPDAPWASVGSLDVNGQLYTATLIDPQHVLSAAHVVGHPDPKRVVFRSPLHGGLVVHGQAVYTCPAYSTNRALNIPGDPTIHGDLAVVKLAQPVPDTWVPLPIFNGPLLGRTITLVSHHASTSLITVGENQVDVVFNNTLGRPATYLFDYDGPDLASNLLGPAVPANGTLGAQREATLGNGDSGSAALLWFNDRWWLAGINAFQLQMTRKPAAPGAPPPPGPVQGQAAGGVVLGEQLAWLRQVMAGEVAPQAVPKPETSADRRP